MEGNGGEWRRTFNGMGWERREARRMAGKGMEGKGT